MGTIYSKQRLYASLLSLGAGILIYRTIAMISQGSLGILVFWVSALLILEMIMDLSCFSASIYWWIKNDRQHATLALRIGASAAILHAIRVLIFVLGRTKKFFNFDVRPEYWTEYANTWSWKGVYFAAIMSVLGIIGVVLIWYFRRQKIKGAR